MARAASLCRRKGKKKKREKKRYVLVARLGLGLRFSFGSYAVVIFLFLFLCPFALFPVVYFLIVLGYLLALYLWIKLFVFLCDGKKMFIFYDYCIKDFYYALRHLFLT